MKKVGLIFGCVLLSGLLLAWAPQNNATADASKLIALENAWNQAQMHHDAKAVSNLVSDSFIYTDYDGTVMNKADFLKDLKDPDYRASLVANDGVRVISRSSSPQCGSRSQARPLIATPANGRFVPEIA